MHVDCRRARSHHHLDDYSLGYFGPDSPFRAYCRWLIELPSVDACVMASVVISSLLLTLDTPRLDEASPLANALRLSNYAFTALFAVEAGLKAVAYGVWWTGPHAYLRSAWNVLDFSILLIAVRTRASSPRLEPLAAAEPLTAELPYRWGARSNPILAAPARARRSTSQ